MADAPAPQATHPAPAEANSPSPAPPVQAPDATKGAAVAQAPAATEASAAIEAPPAAEPASVDDPLTAALTGSEPAFADQSTIDELLKQANFEDPATVAGAAAPAPETEEFKLPDFQQVMQEAQVSSIDLLRDVELNVKIELGRSRMLVEDVLKLAEGSVVELDKLAGDPVDVFVNDRLVARGEVLVLNDNFCVRINEIVAGVKEEGM